MAKIRAELLCRLPFSQFRFLGQELSGNNGADLSVLDHLVDLFEADPFGVVRLAGLENHILQRNVGFYAVMIVEDIPLPVGTQELKFLRFCPDAGFFEQLPHNGLAAVFPRPGGTAGIFPGTGIALALSPAGQEQIAPAVIDPNADHKAVLTETPGRAPLMDPAGQLPPTVINIIKFHKSPSFPGR